MSRLAHFSIDGRRVVHGYRLKKRSEVYPENAATKTYWDGWRTKVKTLAPQTCGYLDGIALFNTKRLDCFAESIMADPAQLGKAVQAIQSMPEFKGCRIGYQGIYGGGGPVSRSLFPGETPALNYGRVIVVIEELVDFDPLDNANTSQWALTGTSPSGAPNPVIVENRSKLGPELIGMGFTCGLTVVAAVGVFGGAAAEVPSGGMSTFVVVASWTAMFTQGIECVNSLARLGVIAYDPAGSELEALDNIKWYSVTMLLVDAVNVVSGIATLPAALKNLWAILARQRSFAVKALSEAALRQMNAAQRAKVISELIVEATRTPEGLQAVINASREAELGAASIQRASLSVRNATRMTGVIADETVKRLKLTLLSIFSVPVGSAVSSSPARWVGGAASGSLNYIINCIDTGT